MTLTVLVLAVALAYGIYHDSVKGNPGPIYRVGQALVVLMSALLVQAVAVTVF